MTFSPLSIEGIKPPPPRDHGAAPQLVWVALADCGVDRDYQRDMTPDSRRKVEKIAAEFDWSCFAPLIVSPVAGGKYAMIDGQHRGTAALLVGETQAPAMVVIADRARQAKSFAAINGTITRMSALQVFRAARAAGDPEALAVDAIAARCGVRVLTHKTPANLMQPGDCIAAAVLVKALRDYGAETLERVLTAIMASRGDKRGLVSTIPIRSLCIVFKTNGWALETIRRAFAHVDLRELEAKARKDGFEGIYSDLAAEIKVRLAQIAKSSARAA